MYSDAIEWEKNQGTLSDEEIPAHFNPTSASRCRRDAHAIYPLRDLLKRALTICWVTLLIYVVVRFLRSMFLSA